MPTVWTDAPEVKNIAETLIENEDEFHDIKIYEPKIKYLFKSTKKSKDSGQCQKATGPWKYLTEFSYVIWIWKEWWQEAPPNEREALIYHELMHVDIEEDEDSGEMKFKLKRHDVECFISEVEKYSDWHGGLTQLKNAMIE